MRLNSAARPWMRPVNGLGSAIVRRPMLAQSLRYLLPLSLVIAFEAIRIALDGRFAALTPALFSALAVVLTAGLAGRGPALLGTICGAIVAAGLVPGGECNPADVAALLVIGACASLLAGRAESARRMARREMDALRASEQKLRLLVDSVQDCAVFLLDRSGRIASWNAGAQRQTGWVFDEIVGRHFTCFYRDSDVAAGQPQRSLDAATSVGRHEERGWRVRCDGTTYRAHSVVTAIRDDAGQLRGFGELVREIAAPSAPRSIAGLMEEHEMHLAREAVGAK